MPPGLPEERPVDLREPIDFTHPDFAMTIRMENSNNGVSRYYFSYDRGRSWRGPYRLPLFGQKGVMGRTDYLVNGPNDCMLFLTASKANGREGRPFCAAHGGWRPDLAIRLVHRPRTDRVLHHAVDGAGLDDRTGDDHSPEGPSQELDRGVYVARRRPVVVARIRPGAGHGRGEPAQPRLTLPDGRLCLTYGVRSRPYGIRARLSADRAQTWGDAIVLRDDGGSTDVGYVRSIVRPDGKVVVVYYYTDRSSPTRYIAATIWEPRPLLTK